MPELPEVENARATLQRYLAGRPIGRVRAERARPVEDPPARLKRELTGSRAGRAQRRGKQLVLPLTGPDGRRFGLSLHLGMTGRIAVLPPGASAPRFSRFSIQRDEDGLSVHLCDSRRFGRVALTQARRIGETPEARALGPDPILDEWSPAVLRQALAGTKRAVKEVLMDQARLAGVGNIYAAEAAWRARVHPQRPADSLTRAEIARLAEAVHEVLDEQVVAFRKLLNAAARRLARGDAEAFGGPLYMSEGAGNPFAVYGRTAEPCPRCSAEIDCITLGARSSFYCPSCQR